MVAAPNSGLDAPTMVTAPPKWSQTTKLWSQLSTMVTAAPTMATAANHGHRRPNNGHSSQKRSQPQEIVAALKQKTLPPQLWSQPRQYQPPAHLWSQPGEMVTDAPTMVKAASNCHRRPRNGHRLQKCSAPRCVRSSQQQPRSPNYGHSPLTPWSQTTQPWSWPPTTNTDATTMVTTANNGHHWPNNSQSSQKR